MHEGLRPAPEARGQQCLGPLVVLGAYAKLRLGTRGRSTSLLREQEELARLVRLGVRWDLGRAGSRPGRTFRRSPVRRTSRVPLYLPLHRGQGRRDRGEGDLRGLGGGRGRSSRGGRRGLSLPAGTRAEAPAVRPSWRGGPKDKTQGIRRPPPPPPKPPRRYGRRAQQLQGRSDNGAGGDADETLVADGADALVARGARDRVGDEAAGGAPRSPLLRWVRSGEDRHDRTSHRRGHVGRPRIVRYHDRRPPDERRERAEAHLAADGYPRGACDPPGKILLTRTPGDEHRQPSLPGQLLDYGGVAFGRVRPRGGARPWVDDGEACFSSDAVPFQKLCGFLFFLFTRNEHHLRLDRREAQVLR